jgi:CHAT domain-containing protein
VLRACAAQVMASAWSVWDAATLRLMENFYARLGAHEGTDLADILMASARAIRAGATDVLASATKVERKAAGFWQRLVSSG